MQMFTLYSIVSQLRLHTRWRIRSVPILKTHCIYWSWQRMSTAPRVTVEITGKPSKPADQQINSSSPIESHQNGTRTHRNNSATSGHSSSVAVVVNYWTKESSSPKTGQGPNIRRYTCPPFDPFHRPGLHPLPRALFLHIMCRKPPSGLTLRP